ncbi:hypothetical protein GN244_ATG00069 [Phytophthora infestans]|uniref:Uncharacterized protein n=1 Tax=Phytophthora infestans TaxID=4787 RepID=A0A833TQW1_PHYIN|nr:hypothetical protein GN244_ATG00069 [Phytophthora infestans]
MLVVDVWVLAGRPDNFLQWARKAVPTDIGANVSGTCLFNALQQAVQLLGEPSAVPDAEVDRFLADADKRGSDFSRGVRWKIVTASNTMGVGHALVLEVQGHKYTAHDESIKGSLEQYGEWINRLMFVRKVALEA